jgi:hypothetical protein
MKFSCNFVKPYPNSSDYVFLLKHQVKALHVDWLRRNCMVNYGKPNKNRYIINTHRSQNQDHAPTEPPPLLPMQPEMTPYHTWAAAPTSTPGLNSRTYQAGNSVTQATRGGTLQHIFLAATYFFNGKSSYMKQQMFNLKENHDFFDKGYFITQKVKR